MLFDVVLKRKNTYNVRFFGASFSRSVRLLNYLVLAMSLELLLLFLLFLLLSLMLLLQLLLALNRLSIYFFRAHLTALSGCCLPFTFV